MDRSDLRRGIRDGSPLLPGVVPFGVVVGIASAKAGLALLEAVAMSVVVFAGASQLAALDLLGRDAPLAIVLLTGTVINLRMLMYSASIAPYLTRFSGRVKATIAYMLTDQAFALAILEFRSERSVDRVAYYLGIAAMLWVAWQIATVAGFLIGAGIPDAWGLDFAVPLVFLAVLVPAIENWPGVVAALVGGSVAFLAAGLPLNLGLLIGAASGITGGLAAEQVWRGPHGD
jgi:4-azaleucine resistance transporter AzlC